MKIQKVTIIGVGLIGGSLGLAIKEKFPDIKVTGTSRNKKRIEKAIERKIVDTGTTDQKNAVEDADIVFICTPVKTIRSVFEGLLPSLKKGAVVTDVGSTKSEIVKEIEGIIPEDVFFIGGHPLAGSEREGMDAASSSLFSNSYYVLTPTEKTNTEAFKTLHNLLTKIGANVIAIDPKRHDRIVAYISHLPHILASSLVNIARENAEDVEDLLLFAAGGFRDMTRIAAGSTNIWVDIFLSNSATLKKVVDRFQKVLDGLKEAIEKKDDEALAIFLEKARDARLNMPISKDKDLKLLRDLIVPVTDRPGVLSEVTVAIGKIGINIEDIEIIHGDGKGLLRITVTGEENAEKALRELRKLNFKPRIKKAYDEE